MQTNEILNNKQREGTSSVFEQGLSVLKMAFSFEETRYGYLSPMKTQRIRSLYNSRYFKDGC